MALSVAPSDRTGVLGAACAADGYRLVWFRRVDKPGSDTALCPNCSLHTGGPRLPLLPDVGLGRDANSSPRPARRNPMVGCPPLGRGVRRRLVWQAAT